MHCYSLTVNYELFVPSDLLSLKKSSNKEVEDKAIMILMDNRKTFSHSSISLFSCAHLQNQNESLASIMVSTCKGYNSKGTFYILFICSHKISKSVSADYILRLPFCTTEACFPPCIMIWRMVEDEGNNHEDEHQLCLLIAILCQIYLEDHPQSRTFCFLFHIFKNWLQVYPIGCFLFADLFLTPF